MVNECMPAFMPPPSLSPSLSLGTLLSENLASPISVYFRSWIPHVKD